ncbi:unnamed protein product [Microthlaspi erraticum]|uniref:Uncharacterized protein n=1 Tax=Microthlaspi erraticum TaxID=1685480 RepID=A0A6D2KCU0_9BRAS|nr:unnamed protein product [Microthlaspi erraticum]
MNQQKSTAETHLKIDTMYNDLNGKYEAVWTHVKKLDVQVAQTAEAVKRPQEPFLGKESKTPGTSKEKADENLEEEAEVDRAASSRLDRAGDDASSSQEPVADFTYSCSCRDCSSQSLHPKMIPALKKYMKELISGKVAEDENVMLVSEECSAVLQNKVIKKRSDPGRFVLSVQIGHDLRMLSLRSWLEREPDAIDQVPVGILEDLHVQIGNTLIPADFVVLELDEEPKDPSS